MIYIKHNNAKNLNAFIDLLQPFLTIDIDSFTKGFFDIDTCSLQGLLNWGRILNFSQTIYQPDLDNCFGFANGGPYTDGKYPGNFNNSNFWGGQLKPVLIDQEFYRILLKVRYQILTTNASLASANLILNRLVQFLSSTNKVKVEDAGTMLIKITTNFLFTDLQYTIFNNRTFLPIPMGVDFQMIQGVTI